MSTMVCGKCGHPMHWKGCVRPNTPALCDCRNDAATYDPDPRSVEDESPRRTAPHELHAHLTPCSGGLSPDYTCAVPVHVCRSTSKAFFLTLGLAFLGGWVVRGLR